MRNLIKRFKNKLAKRRETQSEVALEDALISRIDHQIKTSRGKFAVYLNDKYLTRIKADDIIDANKKAQQIYGKTGRVTVRDVENEKS